MPSSEPVAIALGSNLGNSLATLTWAVSALKTIAEGGVLRCSPWFRSAAVGGPPNQPDYINGVVLLHCSGSPMALLQRLQALERQAGRRPGPRWGPRVLDLDLLWFGQRRSATPELLLPHPRWQQRSFVLAPLAALDPRLVAPHAPAVARNCCATVPLPIPSCSNTVCSSTSDPVNHGVQWAVVILTHLWPWPFPLPSPPSCWTPWPP